MQRNEIKSDEAGITLIRREDVGNTTSYKLCIEDGHLSLKSRAVPGSPANVGGQGQ
jgi:hypothetical protein